MPVPEKPQLLELWALGHDCQGYGCQDHVQGPKAPTERPAMWNQAGTGQGALRFHQWTDRSGRRGIGQVFNTMLAELNSTSASQWRN